MPHITSFNANVNQDLIYCTIRLTIKFRFPPGGQLFTTCHIVHFLKTGMEMEIVAKSGMAELAWQKVVNFGIFVTLSNFENRNTFCRF